MDVTISSQVPCLAFRKDSSNELTPLVFSKDPFDYLYQGDNFSGTVKEAIDELFRLLQPKGPNYIFYRVPISNSTINTTFVVPAGITELFVLLINSGKNASGTNSGVGGEAYSFYLSVTPGQELAVSLGGTTSSSGNMTNGYAEFAGYGTFKEQVPVENRLFNSQAGRGGTSTSSMSGAGGGGFMVESEQFYQDPEKADTIAEEWFSLACTSQPDGSPTAASGTTVGKGWPSANGNGSSPNINVGGRGGEYGGGGGAERSGTSTASEGRGGNPFIAVFWGKGIRPDGQSTPAAIAPVE